MSGLTGRFLSAPPLLATTPRDVHARTGSSISIGSSITVPPSPSAFSNEGTVFGDDPVDEKHSSPGILAKPTVTYDASGKEHSNPAALPPSQSVPQKRGFWDRLLRKAPRQIVDDNADDDNIDPAPFPFQPSSLAHLFDPKSLEEIEKLGGSSGILTGLGTSAENGLSTKGAPPKQSLGSPVPAIMLTEPEGRQAQVDNEAALAATFADRQRVYGENVLPTRKSKSLLLLMFIALKDRVLVCFHFYFDEFQTLIFRSLDPSMHCRSYIAGAGIISRLRFAS